MGSAPWQLSQLTDGGSLPLCMICHLLCIDVFWGSATLHYRCALHGPSFEHLYLIHLRVFFYFLIGLVPFSYQKSWSVHAVHYSWVSSGYVLSSQRTRLWWLVFLLLYDVG
jgi:hypothetical protein